jgi:hypothetical protein
MKLDFENLSEESPRHASNSRDELLVRQILKMIQDGELSANDGVKFMKKAEMFNLSKREYMSG